MIEKGSKVILITKDAIYSPCEVVVISDNNVTVTYLAGTKRDRKTGEFSEIRPIETIPRKNIVKMSERI